MKSFNFVHASFGAVFGGFLGVVSLWLTVPEFGWLWSGLIGAFALGVGAGYFGDEFWEEFPKKWWF